MYGEAEDRLPQSASDFPPMQTSSFAGMFDVATRNLDNSYDPAFGYNEHQQRHHDQHHDFGKRTM